MGQFQYLEPKIEKDIKLEGEVVKRSDSRNIQQFRNYFDQHFKDIDKDVRNDTNKGPKREIPFQLNNVTLNENPTIKTTVKLGESGDKLVDTKTAQQTFAEEALKCRKCKFTSTDDEAFRIHIKDAHGQRWYIKKQAVKCDECDYTAPYKRTLNQHIEANHNKNKQHKCPDCDPSTSFPENLEHHKKNFHTEIESYKCDKCEFV